MRSIYNNQNYLKQFVIFTPLAIICLGLLLLGILFIQSYDSGNALPHVSKDSHNADSPNEEPLVGTVDIADTSDLPTKLPSLPTPAKQTVIHAMQHRQQPTPQPERPLPAVASTVAQAATTTPGKVLGAVDQQVDNATNPQQNNPPVPDETPIPPIPVPNSPQIVD